MLQIEQLYSTTKMLIKLDGIDSFLDKEGKIRDELKFCINNSTFNIHNSKFPTNPNDKFETVLFLPEGEGRKGEGGLRTKGYLKSSYKFVDDEWYICDYNGEIKAKVPDDIRRKIDDYLQSITHHTPITNYQLPITNNLSQITFLPLISVITVVFNGEKYLEQTIQSVINQTYPNVEYIIIDGGSTDGTLDIIRKYEHAIDYWVSERDKGISDAFNKGIICATGDIVGIINADDWYENYTTERVFIKYLLNLDYDIFCGKMKFIINENEYFTLKSIPSRLNITMSVNHPTVFIKTSLYKKEGLFSYEYKYAMDYDLMLRLFRKSYKFIVLDDILSNMRLYGKSFSNYIDSYKEVKKIKIDLLGNYFTSNMYFIIQVFFRFIRDLLPFRTKSYQYYAKFKKFLISKDE